MIAPSKMPGLDGWRAFAFLFVFMYHQHVLAVGYLGVQAFFVLSGYLLVPILSHMRESIPDRSRFLICFYGRRSLRIFPLYYAFLALVTVGAIAALVWGAGGGETRQLLRDLPFAYSYLYNFRLAMHSAVDPFVLGHLWSLAVEEQFYIVLPLIVLLLSPRRLPLALGAMMVAGPLIRAGIYFAAVQGGPAWGSNTPDITVYMLPFSHGDAFAAGGLAAMIGQRYNRSSAPVALGALAAAFGLGLAASTLEPGGIRWTDLGFPPFMKGVWRCVWGYSVVNIAFALCLRAIACDAFIPWVFTCRWVCYLGKISYGLYVYHWPIIQLLKRVAPQMSHGMDFLVSLLLTIGVSIVSYRWLEQPLLSRKDKWFPIRRETGATR